MYDQIYAARQAVDPGRQPDFKHEYEAISALFLSATLTNPYVKSNAHLAASKGAGVDAFFQGGCLGPSIQPTSIAGDFVYRITSFTNLLRYTSPALLRRSASEDSNWSILARAQDNLRDWMPASWFFSGSLQGPRGVTWWTPSDITLDIFATCHDIGLPDDWVAQRAVVLRRNAHSSFSFGFMPTIIDGFDSPIFCATQSHSTEKLGRCVSLESLPLSLGGYELVSEPLPVSELSVYVVSTFQLPTSWAPIMMPSSMSVSRERPRQMTVLPGGGS